MFRENFIKRQVMDEPFFEYHHFCDTSLEQIDFHQHSFYEIYIFLSGNVNYNIEGRTYPLRKGDIMLTNSNDIHRPDILSSDEPYERIVLWLDDGFFDFIKEIGDDLTTCFKDASNREYRLVHLDSEQLHSLLKLCSIIEDQKTGNSFGKRALSYAIVLEMIVLISRAYYKAPDIAQKNIIENPDVNRTLVYITEHLSEELTLDNISDEIHVSKYHLNRQFKAFTGLTMHQYILKKRLTVASNLLLKGESATAVCLQCGFGDYSNFTKAFKKEFGKAPSEFR